MLNRMTRIAAPFAAFRARPLRGAHAPVALAMLSLVVALFSGCSGGCSRAPEAPAPVLDRMKDADYVKELKKQLADQKEIAGRVGAIGRELDAARAEDPESKKTKELEKKYAAVQAEFEKCRLLGQAIIRERKAREDAERAKAKTSDGKK